MANLNIAAINEAYKKFDKNVNINGQQTLINYDVEYNKDQQQYVLDKSRYTNSNQPTKYYFPADQLYDYQDINHGDGPGVNVDADDKLTRGNIVSKPIDKLAEKDFFDPYRIILPTQVIPIRQAKFLVSTSLAADPQKKYDPYFDIAGLNTRNYARKPDTYYKNKYARY